MGNINTGLQKISPSYLMAVSVDCVIFGYGEGKLKVLLLECAMDPFIGKYSLVGDLVKQDEDLSEAAQRILGARTGLKDVYLEQVKTFGAPDRHPLGRVVTVAYYSLVKIDQVKVELGKLERGSIWYELHDGLPDDMAFDHKLILHECHDRLKRQLREKPIGFSLLPKKFTLNQLQSLYEAVLDIELDKRNFRRKLKNIEVLVDLGETQQDVAHRPASLYSFDHQLYQQRVDAGFHFEL